MTMDGLPLNLADISVALILLVSALLAFVRGFFREVMAIAAWVGAFFVALYGFTHVQPYARDLIPIETVADLATGVGLFVVAVVIFSTISHALARGVKDSGLGADVADAPPEGEPDAGMASLAGAVASPVGEGMCGIANNSPIHAEIAKHLAENSIEIEKKYIQLTSNIKKIGSYSANIRLHREVSFELKFEVIKEQK